MVRHKSNNPFKMWGSYVGAILLYILWTIYLWLLSGVVGSPGGRGINFFNVILEGVSNIFILIIISIGFLIGWGIQSLWRKFNK